MKMNTLKDNTEQSKQYNNKQLTINHSDIQQNKYNCFTMHYNPCVV